LLLIRELKRDYKLDGTTTTFNDICDLFDFIKDLCSRECINKDDKDKKVINRKPSSTSTLKSKGKVTNISSHNNKENLKEKENKD